MLWHCMYKHVSSRKGVKIPPKNQQKKGSLQTNIKSGMLNVFSKIYESINIRDKAVKS